MTVGEAIDLILLNVTGGHMTQDANVLRADIRAYLPSAISYFTVMEMRLRRAEGISENGSPSVWSDGSFFGTYTLTPTASGSRWYVDLPGHVLSLFNARGVESVTPAASPTRPYVRISNPQQLAGIDDMLGSQVYYYPETSGEATRLWLINYASPVCDLTVRALLNVDNLADTAPLPVPAGVDMQVINKCVGYFNQQRMTPADTALDANDLNQNHVNGQAG